MALQEASEVYVFSLLEKKYSFSDYSEIKVRPILNCKHHLILVGKLNLKIQTKLIKSFRL